MLEAVQRRATKLVPHLKPLKYNDRLNAIGKPTLKQRRRRGDLIQNFKIYHGFNKVNFIRPNHSAPSISEMGPAAAIRGGNYRTTRELTKCAQREYFFMNRVVPDWNKLLSHVIGINLENSASQKGKVRQNQVI
jgi:hypothetical protein